MITCKINPRRAPHHKETINNSVFLKLFRICSLLPRNNVTQADSRSSAVYCLSLQPLVSFTLPGSETLIHSSHGCQKGEKFQREEKWVEKKGGKKRDKSQDFPAICHICTPPLLPPPLGSSLVLRNFYVSEKEASQED